MMENGNTRQDKPRMRAGGQWTSSHCVEKVEEMLSRAIIHQEDLWGLLVKHAPLDDSSTPGEVTGVEESMLSPLLLRALKVKLENSLDWCHLALCRLKEIIVHTGSYHTSEEGEEDEETAAVVAGVAHAPSLNVPSPLSALRVSKEPLSSYPFSNAGRFHNEWSPGSFFFLNESPQMPSRSAQTCDGEQLQESMDLIVPDGEHHQPGQRYLRLPSLGFDSDWNMLAAEAQASVLPAASPRAISAPGAEARQSSSSCPLNVPDASENGAENEDRNIVTKLNSRGLRPRCGTKRDREETDEKDTTVTVVFQELKAGDDTKKGIPDDGHRGWKKYGNKTIQNSNFCRGYYKCSMKDCRAKKMVQQTDKDPHIFEVTYVGNHTCSSTSRRRIRSRTSNSSIPRVEHPHSTADELADVPASTDILVQTKIARLLKNQPGCALVTEADRSTGDGNYESDLPRPEKSWPSPGIQTAEEDVPDVGNAADSKEACSLEELDEDDESSRDERLGFAFPSDSLLWQEIMNSSHREVWNSLQVEI